MNPHLPARSSGSSTRTRPSKEIGCALHVSSLVSALGVGGALYRTLRSTNAIENLNGLVGHFVRNVRCWRNGRMLVRWIATALHEVGRSFRRLRGHRDLAAL